MYIFIYIYIYMYIFIYIYIVLDDLVCSIAEYFTSCAEFYSTKYKIQQSCFL